MYLQLMLTSYTSSEEEKYSPNFLKTSGKTTRFVWRYCWLDPCQLLCKLWEHRPQLPDLVNCSPLPTRDWSLNPLEETLLQSVLKIFITVSIQNNEGLKNNLTRAPLLGLAKSILFLVSRQPMTTFSNDGLNKFQEFAVYYKTHRISFCFPSVWCKIFEG